jgi:hypothetical protein
MSVAEKPTPPEVVQRVIRIQNLTIIWTLTDVFCGEFLANPMILEIPVGGGIPREPPRNGNSARPNPPFPR